MRRLLCVRSFGSPWGYQGSKTVLTGLCRAFYTVWKTLMRSSQKTSGEFSGRGSPENVVEYLEARELWRASWKKGY